MRVLLYQVPGMSFRPQTVVLRQQQLGGDASFCLNIEANCTQFIYMEVSGRCLIPGTRYQLVELHCCCDIR